MHSLSAPAIGSGVDGVGAFGGGGGGGGGQENGGGGDGGLVGGGGWPVSSALSNKATGDDRRGEGMVMTTARGQGGVALPPLSASF